MKTLLFTISFLFIFALLPHQTLAACSGFQDVDANVWYCDTISKLRAAKVLDELPTFNPNQIMPRDQAMKVIYKITGKNVPEYSDSLFDISAGSDAVWYRSYFAHAYGSNIIKPEGDKFNPGKAISKSEFLVLLLKTFDSDVGSDLCTIPGGTLSSTWLETINYKEYLCKALEMGIAKSAYDDQTITRAVAMQMIYNTMK